MATFLLFSLFLRLLALQHRLRFKVPCVALESQEIVPVVRPELLATGSADGVAGRSKRHICPSWLYCSGAPPLRPRACIAQPSQAIPQPAWRICLMPRPEYRRRGARPRPHAPTYMPLQYHRRYQAVLCR